MVTLTPPPPRRLTSDAYPWEAENVSVSISSQRAIFVRFHDVTGQVFAFAKMHPKDATILADELLKRIEDARPECPLDGGSA
jgi:hypothetical protein